MEPRKVIIIGAAGRDFHNFNTFYRDNPAYKVVAFTAAQIPDIAGRKYPASLAGSLYPDGIPIYEQSELEKLIKEADGFLMENIDYISAPILDFLDGGEIKTLTMFDRHFRAGGHFLVHLLEYLASKGIIERLSETVRITTKSRPSFEEIAFMSLKDKI
jgi:hypothetical protein